jgi:hypothetical protein
MNKFRFLLAIVLIALHPISASTGAELIVSIPDQTVVLVEGGKLIARYRVSTSKFGNGDSSGSYRTPLGSYSSPENLATICRPAPSLRIGCPPAK